MKSNKHNYNHGHTITRLMLSGLLIGVMTHPKAQCAHSPALAIDAYQQVENYPALAIPLEQEKVMAQRTARKKRKVTLYLLAGIGTRVASRQAYDRYLLSDSSDEASSLYTRANTLHKISLGSFSMAGITWVGQIFSRPKK